MSCDGRCGGGCSGGVSVIDKFVLGHHAVVFVWAEMDWESASAGRPREEAVVLFSTWNCIVMITDHIPSSVEEGVVVEETGEFC